MHQDTLDALDILSDALTANPDDALGAADAFDALPGVREARQALADEMEAESRAARAEAAFDRSRRTSSRVGRSVRNGDGHQIGDTVYFNRRTSNYLLGLPIKVVGTNGASVNVEVPDDSRYRRFAGQTAVRCPNTIVCKSLQEALA